ncbi:MAG: ribonuclease H-like domain-containing protein [Candidatus Thermoplasmatota archaeon]|jgi:DNA polymerase elongation subunit (family B)|nr:ribonuclease H-like domain-containing protein [Candidatus Thermoplasmatota archaeon]MCL5790545.1 ribonuclease H-like domain-containing protein [Candidatus Thermoplasmatota archaeon]
MDYSQGLSRISSRIGKATRVISIDLETLVREHFLNNERIIAISYATLDGNWDVKIGNPARENDEIELLQWFNRVLEDYSPEIIIGYNHASYDVPLINTKMLNIPFDRQLWNLRYYFGTAYLLDMMYVCALHGMFLNGEYRIRSLKNVVNAPEYSSLDLIRAKEEVEIEGMGKGEAIEWLWRNDLQRFRRYCEGDVVDLITLYSYIFKNQIQ